MRVYTKWTLFCLILLLFPTTAFTQGSGPLRVTIPDGEDVRLYEKSYALVVGNGDYQHPPWDPLPGALRDVAQVKVELEKIGFEVTLAQNLTADGFLRVFRQFTRIKGRDSNSRLLFYYAGHGYSQKLANDQYLGYLVMIDAPDPIDQPVEFSLKSIDMEAIATEAKVIQARHVLFLFDSCFSGTILNMRASLVPKVLSDLIRYPVRQFITAGRAHEPVPDHSFFKQVFLDAIAGRIEEPIPDGYLTGEELGLLLKTKVPEYFSRQHPQYGKINDPHLDKGDFVFALAPKKEEPFRSPTPSTDEALPERQGRYTIQVAAYNIPTMAKTDRDRLKMEGLPARVEGVKSGDRTFYRLLVGAFPSKQSALEYSRELKQGNKLGILNISHGGFVRPLMKGEAGSGLEMPEPQPTVLLRVVNVADWDVLYIRQAPDPDSPKVGQSPHNGVGIQYWGVQSRYKNRIWYKIRVNGREGWANSYYLAPMN